MRYMTTETHEVEEIECNDYRHDGCTADDGEPCPKCLARQGVDVFETALWNATAPRLRALPGVGRPGCG